MPVTVKVGIEGFREGCDAIGVSPEELLSGYHGADVLAMVADEIMNSRGLDELAERVAAKDKIFEELEELSKLVFYLQEKYSAEVELTYKDGGVACGCTEGCKGCRHDWTDFL